jgi:hypothetical protein
MDSGQIQKVFGAAVVALAASGAVVVDARGMSSLTVITAAGATATVSRVDSATAGAHTSGAENSFTVAASTRTVTAVDWPFYRVSVAGGAARVALS